MKITKISWKWTNLTDP